MKAHEARLLSKKNEVGNPMYQQIIQEIKIKAQNGKYEFYATQPISDSIRELLKNDGYTVGETQWDRGYTLTKISW